jgi:hypothetical protein
MGATMQTLNQRAAIRLYNSRPVIQIVQPIGGWPDYEKPTTTRTEPGPMAVPTRTTARRRSLLRFAVGLLIVSTAVLVGLATH